MSSTRHVEAFSVPGLSLRVRRISGVVPNENWYAQNNLAGMGYEVTIATRCNGDSRALRLLQKLRQLATAEWLPLPDETECL